MVSPSFPSAAPREAVFHWGRAKNAWLCMAGPGHLPGSSACGHCLVLNAGGFLLWDQQWMQSRGMVGVEEAPPTNLCSKKPFQEARVVAAQRNHTSLTQLRDGERALPSELWGCWEPGVEVSQECQHCSPAKWLLGREGRQCWGGHGAAPRAGSPLPNLVIRSVIMDPAAQVHNFLWEAGQNGLRAPM